jgi:exopolysaccharide production protein ExoQ
MPPELALLICTAFVLFLLRLERKQAPEVSRALWIPTVWILCIATKPLGIWFGVEADTDGSPLDRMVFSGLLCLGLLVLAMRKSDWPRAIRGNPWLVLLIGYMLVSIFWSDILYSSFKRWIRELLAVIMALLVASERDPREAVKSVMTRTVYILIPFSPILINYFPKLGRQYNWSGMVSWTGVATQKNGLGRLCLISAFFLIWTLVRRWKGRDKPVLKYQTAIDVLILIITLWLLKGPPGGYSATAIAALAVGLAMFFGLLWMKKLRIRLGANTLPVIMALVIGYGIASPIAGGLYFGEDISSTLGRDDSLTGRTEIWAKLVPIALKQPILGHGFGGFWTTERREVYASEAHSGYLDALLQLGFIGLLFIATYLLSSCRKAQRLLAEDFDWGVLWICFLVMVVVHNVTESSIDSFSSHLTAVLLFLAISSGATFGGAGNKSDISKNNLS